MLRKHPQIWVTIVLWVASNAMVTGVAKVATWEGIAKYHSGADLCQWDCAWYASVLSSGYDKSPPREGDDSANWQFHPLFPLTAYPFHHWLKLSLSWSLVLSSKFELLLAIYGFLWMLGDELECTADCFRAGSLVAFNPYLIYAHGGYAEPIYFALLAFAFSFASRRRWILSGLSSGLLSATRLVGFLFSISYSIICLKDLGWRVRWRQCELDRLIGFLLCPLGTAAYILYMHHHTGDGLAQVHGLVSWGKSPGNPFHFLWVCLTGHHWLRVWGVMTLAGFAASAWLVKLRRPDLGIFLAISILIPLSAGYWGLPRYIWWQPPFLYTIYLLLRRSTAAWLIYTAFAAAMAAFMIMEWFTGHNFVV